jgi:hypothetical protein
MPHPNISSPLSPKQLGRLAELTADANGRVLTETLLGFARQGLDVDDACQRQGSERWAQCWRQQLARHFPRKTGAVYVAAHPAFPGLVKIGMTRRDPKTRVAALTTSGIPGEFVLLGAVTALDAPAVEAQVHKNLAELRTERELFRTTPEHALDVVRTFAEQDNAMVSRRLAEYLPDLVIPLNG